MKRKEEEEEEKRKRREEEEPKRYEISWSCRKVLVWNLYGIVCMDFFLRILVRGLEYLFFCVEPLFGLVVVLNRENFV